METAERTAPTDETLIVAGADGVIAKITEVHEDKALKTDTIRISIFLNLFDVHVNRSPIAGKATFLGYRSGKRLFTFQEKSSEVNQHNAILVEGEKTRCLIHQIVGPVCRRIGCGPLQGAAGKRNHVAAGQHQGKREYQSVPGRSPTGKIGVHESQPIANEGRALYPVRVPMFQSPHACVP